MAAPRNTALRTIFGAVALGSTTSSGAAVSLGPCPTGRGSVKTRKRRFFPLDPGLTSPYSRPHETILNQILCTRCGASARGFSFCRPDGGGEEHGAHRAGTGMHLDRILYRY